MKNESLNLEEINDIAYRYQYYLETLNDKAEFLSEDDDNDVAINFISRVYHTLSNLNEAEKEIITNEFFVYLGDSWWKRKYSKNQFISLLNSSISHFLVSFEKYGH